MKSGIRQRIAVLLCLTMVMSIISPGVCSFADTEGDKAEYTVSGTYVNPIYAGSLGAEAGESSPIRFDSSLDGKVCNSIEEAGAVLRQAMVNRDESVEIYLSFIYAAPDASEEQLDAKAAQLCDVIRDEALKHTGGSKEGDYLIFQYSYMDYQFCFSTDASQGYTTAFFRPVFSTTKEQEQRLDQEINKILTELDISDKSDYEKIKSIYDWVIVSVKYDSQAQPGGDVLPYTPYGAIINRSAVCQGYAMATVRLLSDAGIKSKMITGYGGKPFSYETSHGWIIVKLEGKYYYLDPTWEAGSYQETGELGYLYFLHGSSDWASHFPDNEDLLRSYDISFENYEKKLAYQGGSDIPNDSFGVFVVDQKGNPVQGAKVTGLPVSGTTDGSGLAVFKVTSGMGGVHHIGAEKEGYVEGWITVDVAAGSSCTIVLNSDQEELAIEVVADYKGERTDLLSRYLKFAEYVGEPDRNTSFDKESKLTLNIYTHPELAGLSYEIWSGDAMVVRSGNPTIDFTVYECPKDSESGYTYSALKNFKEAQGVELKVYQNGSQIAVRPLCLSIGKAEKSINGRSEMTMSPSLGPVKKGVKEIPFLEDTELTIGGDLDDKLSLVVCAENGKVRVGLNLKNEFMEKREKSNRKEYFEAVEELKKLRLISKIRDPEERKGFIDKKLQTLNKIVDKKNVKSGQGLLEGNVTLFGYGEGEYKNGLCSISMNIHILMEVEGSATYQTFIASLPVYARGEGKMSMGGQGSLKANLVSEPSVGISDTILDIDIPADFEVKLSVGGGWYSVLSVGGGGSLELNSLFKLRTSEAEATATGSVFGEVYLTPWFHAERKFAKRTVKLYPEFGQVTAENMDAGSLYEDCYDLDQYELAALSSMDSYSSAGGIDDYVVNEKIPRGNMPRLVENSKGEIFAFYFVNEDDSLDSSGLVFAQLVDMSGDTLQPVSVRVTESDGYAADSVLNKSLSLPDRGKSSSGRQSEEGKHQSATPSNGTSVATPANGAAVRPSAEGTRTESTVGKVEAEGISMRALSSESPVDPSTADFYYDIYQNGDIIYIAVSKAKKSLEDMPSDGAEEITEILKTSEIYLFHMDMQTKKVSLLQQLTDDDAADINPRIYLDGDGLHVAWLSIVPGEKGLFADDTEYIVKLYDDQTKEIREKSAGSSLISGLAIGKLDNKAVAVYSADTDGNRATIDDVELFAYDGKSVTQMTDNHVVDYAPQFYDNYERLIWNQKGAVYETRGINGGSQVIDDSALVAPGFKVIEGEGQLYLVWEDVDPTDNQVAIHMLQKKDDGWGAPFTVYKKEDYVTSPVDGYVNSQGLNLLHINTDNIFEEEQAGSALIFSRNLARTNLSVEAVTFDSDRVETGKPLPLSIWVRNNGNTIITEIALGVDDEEIKTVSVDLYPGETKELQISFVVPELEKVIALETFARVTAAKGVGGEDIEGENPGRAADEEGSTGRIELGYTDLAVDIDLEVINGIDYLAVSVTNNSYMPSRASLKLQADSETGMVLSEELLEQIPARTTRVKRYRLSEVCAGFAIESIAAVVVPEAEETITGNNIGTVYIEGLNERYRLNVEAGEGGTVNRVSGSYGVGTEIQLKAFPLEGYRFVRWECPQDVSTANNEAQETTFYMPGIDTAIKAVFENLKDRKVQSINILPPELSMNVGQASILGLEILPEDAGDKTVTWHSTNPGVASVDAGGKVTGVARGTAEIYCVSNDGGNVESLHCTVKISGSSGGGSSGGGGGGSSSGGGGGGGGGSSKGTSKGNGGPTAPAVLKDTYENSSWVQGADGTWKLLKADGTPVTGWAVKSNAWYYMEPASQLMTTGWIFVDNIWYYMTPASGAMATGWVSVDNVWYYLNPSGGAMATGWVSVDNVWYYLNPSGGAMMTGWILVDKSWYYMDPVSGAMAVGWKDINNKQYYFYEDGKLAVSTKTPDGFDVDGAGEKIK